MRTLCCCIVRSFLFFVRLTCDLTFLAIGGLHSKLPPEALLQGASRKGSSLPSFPVKRSRPRCNHDRRRCLTVTTRRDELARIATFLLREICGIIPNPAHFRKGVFVIEGMYPFHSIDVSSAQRSAESSLNFQGYAKYFASLRYGCLVRFCSNGNCEAI